MSEIKKDINDVDAAEMLEGYRKENPVSEEKSVGEEQKGQISGRIVELIHDFERDAKRYHRQKGWEAFGLCLLCGLTVADCCAAVLYGCWKPIVMGIGAANLMMAGAWWQKAKEGWQKAKEGWRA